MDFTKMVETEKEGDPGIVIDYDEDAIHEAAAQAGSPVQQMPTAALSAREFKKWVFDALLLTPLDQEEQCIMKWVDTASGTTEYFPNLFHRMPQDLFRKVERKLKELFITGNTATARWSLQVSDPNGLPPGRPLGTLIRVSGGLGLGQVDMSIVHVPSGIFKSP